ncbi:hypothetical protein AK812_SmicGene8971 [Symbiodinium microadriaticum]|uniref:Peptidase M23 domain-containing protein n=1 Tax=Symbiodinium microadriaticum TaxID=2951 RepID=A0A1Q9EJK9_SYMMI|nr:hypothetical protein AK812_SmicGene8971 [Symbiodinium microadriaticum]
MHTPVLSIGDGIVKEIAQTHKCGGIHAANLAKWNSVSVSSRNKEQTAIVHLAVVLESGIIVDYLHILADTARVQVGDHVRRGQVLCESGDIGFAPEPQHDFNDTWSHMLRPVEFRVCKEVLKQCPVVGGHTCSFIAELGKITQPKGYIVNTFEGDGGKTQFFHNPYRAETSTPREVRWEAEDREGGFVKMAGKPRMPTTLDGPGV